MSERPAAIPWSVWITRAIGLWVLVGAALKLLWSNETQLPRLVQQLPLEPGLTFRIAIAAEIVVGLLALLRPRWSWLLVIALLVLFDVALVAQILEGQPTCGCFGPKFPVSPWVMLAVDTVLLLLLLVARPWSATGTDAAGALLATLVVLGAALLPWALNREVADPSELQGSLLPPYVALEVDGWKPGQPLAETPLGPWVDEDALPSTALWILYRDSCEVCATLLNYLSSVEDGRREIVLVRLPEKGAEGPRKVHVKPKGPWVHDVALPEKVEWLLATPGVMVVEGGKVRWAATVADVDDFLRRDKR